MNDADTIQPLNGRPPYEAGDAEAFFAHVGSGGKVEADDWMPDEYRAAVLKFVEMHANSELMGVLPERDWIMRAPTLRRKLALTSKIQDEVGHAQLLYRVAEELGKSRTAMLQDLLDGRTKFHNVFHYPTRSWADVGIIAWLVDAAAIVSQQALRDSSYAPYARTSWPWSGPQAAAAAGPSPASRTQAVCSQLRRRKSRRSWLLGPCPVTTDFSSAQSGSV